MWSGKKKDVSVQSWVFSPSVARLIGPYVELLPIARRGGTRARAGCFKFTTIFSALVEFLDSSPPLVP